MFVFQILLNFMRECVAKLSEKGYQYIIVIRYMTHEVVGGGKPETLL